MRISQIHSAKANEDTFEMEYTFINGQRKRLQVGTEVLTGIVNLFLDVARAGLYFGGQQLDIQRMNIMDGYVASEDDGSDHDNLA